MVTVTEHSKGWSVVSSLNGLDLTRHLNMFLLIYSKQNYWIQIARSVKKDLWIFLSDIEANYSNLPIIIQIQWPH